MSDSRLVVLSTAPDDEVAAQLAATLVGDRLAACVNVVGGVRSFYRWEGQVQIDDEVLIIIKTDAAHLEQLTERLVSEHPYECPEVVALPIAGGYEGYLSWLSGSLAP